MPAWMSNLLPIVVLLAVIAIVLTRLPKVDLGHSDAFKRRRFLNWFPLGLTYAFLYMGRYNFSANAASFDAAHMLDKAEFGNIDGWSSMVYGLAFLLNGPLTDRWGGRATILLSAGGSAVANVLLGVLVANYAGMAHTDFVRLFTLLSCVNMYFQSFGAVSIVKVNAPWFHVRERGVQGGVFGIMISLGLYFAYDWTRLIAKEISMPAAFYVPAAILLAFVVIGALLIRDTPVHAGFKDFDVGDASSGRDESKPESSAQVIVRMLRSPIILTIVGIEFCSGFLRNAVMKWFIPYASAVGQKDTLIAQNWGVVQCIAGISGGMLAGVISDRLFASRRGPVSAVLYGGITIGALLGLATLGTGAMGWSVMLMTLSVIGVHGMLSGTASADFGGKKNAGVATGIIDGFVYLGTATQGFVLGHVLPKGDLAKDAANWRVWPVAMLPLAIVGLLLAMRIWHATPQQAPAKPAVPPEPELAPKIEPSA